MDLYFVAIRYPNGGKPYYFSTEFADLKPGDMVVVDTIQGLEIGIVDNEPIPTSQYRGSFELKPILRKANSTDISDYEFNQKEAKIAMEICQNEVEHLGLAMNLLSAEYTLDGSKVTITYTSDGRVDFRELLKLLAPQLKCRIELRQIAARDKAKMIGGLGICGLPLCCTTFLNKFDAITIQKVKNQMLNLGNTKLEGACGKLMCCLGYEDDLYTEAKKEFPTIGTTFKDRKNNEYKILGFNILSRTIKLDTPDGIKMVTMDEYDELSGKKPRVEKPKENLESEIATNKPHNNEQGENRHGEGHNRHRHNNGNHPNGENKQGGKPNGERKPHQEGENNQNPQQNPNQNRNNHNKHHRYHHKGHRPNNNGGNGGNPQ
ncbi:MAG: stage 0 sporulation protein [Bacilli bacterium]|nr:stage 0 sporulation protein [Bacilli bacterium]